MSATATSDSTALILSKMSSRSNILNCTKSLPRASALRRPRHFLRICSTPRYCSYRSTYTHHVLEMHRRRSRLGRAGSCSPTCCAKWANTVAFPTIFCLQINFSSISYCYSSASWGEAPAYPTRGFASGSHWGHGLQTSILSSHLTFCRLCRDKQLKGIPTDPLEIP